MIFTISNMGALSMLKTFGIILLGLVLLPNSLAQAGTITQIDSPFVKTLFNGKGGTLSQFDTGWTAGDPGSPNFATSYDNFTFATSGNLSSIEWIGSYDDLLSLPPPPTIISSFDIGIWSDLGGAPGVRLNPLSSLAFTETAVVPAIVGPDNAYFRYSASLSPFAVTGGTQYWVSIVANLDSVNGFWGWSFSPLGDVASVQDFEDEIAPGVFTFVRFQDEVDHAFNLNSIDVNAIPEPSSVLILAGMFATLGLSRIRRKA